MTISISRLIAIAAVGAAALLALRAASFAPVRERRGEVAWARLSWSARPERVEHCRRLTDAELAELPAHMRLRLECEGRFAQYLLQLTVDDSVRLVDTVRGGGLRNDRPMHVLRDVALHPGERRVAVALARLEAAGASDADSAHAARESERPADAGIRTAGDSALGERDLREREERERRTGEAIPPLLTFDTLVTLRLGRVLLITYDGVRRRLAARSGGS